MSEPADAVPNQLAKLKQKYAAGLPEKVGKVGEQVDAFLAAPWQEERCFTTYRLIHSLAGSAGTYGYAELGTVARTGELLVKGSLEGRAPLGDAQRKELAGIVATLKQLAAAAAAP